MTASESNETVRFAGPAKAFCPCDAGHPEDCKPEEWRPAHAPTNCTSCGCPSYQHRGPDRNVCPSVETEVRT